MKYLGLVCLMVLAACGGGGSGSGNNDKPVSAKALWNPKSLQEDADVVAACRGMTDKNAFYLVAKRTSKTVYRNMPASTEFRSAGVTYYSPVVGYAESTEVKDGVETSVHKGTSNEVKVSKGSSDDSQTGEREESISFEEEKNGQPAPQDEILTFTKKNDERWTYSGPELPGLTGATLIECIKKSN